LGTFGAGAIEPEFEMPPPPELTPRLGLLALRTVPSELWSNNLEDFPCIPWGAGLCVVREVASEYRQLIPRLSATGIIDRQGRRLFSGGDDVFSWSAVTIKRGFGVFPELRLTHLISSGRLTRAYFLRLIRDHALSHGVLKYLRSEIRPKPLGVFEYVHILLHGLRNGQFSMRCRWAAVKGQAGAARFIVENGLRPVDWTVSLGDTAVEERESCKDPERNKVVI
jgi:hypothetical protein